MTTRILAVDDSPSVRKMVELTLKTRGYEVATAVDGLDALAALEGAPFSMAVLDINMPGLDGLSLLKAIRERPAWDGLAVLMLTTEGQEADRDRALALGADDYMAKPFKPSEFLARVAVWAAGRGK